MRDPCTTTQEVLGWGGELTPAQAEHVSKCLECSGLAAELARLDQLLTSEPVLPAPPDLAAAVTGRVAERRRREVRWVRAQMLLLAAGAVLAGAVGLALANPVLGQMQQQGQVLARESEVSVSALEGVRQMAFDLGHSLDGLLSSTLSAAPSPPWMALLVILPLLVLVNWSVARTRTSSAA